MTTSSDSTPCTWGSHGAWYNPGDSPLVLSHVLLNAGACHTQNKHHLVDVWVPFAMQFIVDKEVPGVSHNYFILPGLALEGQFDELGRMRNCEMALVVGEPWQSCLQPSCAPEQVGHNLLAHGIHVQRNPPKQSWEAAQLQRTSTGHRVPYQWWCLAYRQK